MAEKDDTERSEQTEGTPLATPSRSAYVSSFWIWTGVSVLAIVYGRVKTYDLTEGQALIHGWPYWTLGILSAMLALLIYRKKLS